MTQTTLVIALIIAAVLVTCGLALSTRRVLGTRVHLIRTLLSSLLAVLSLWPLSLLFGRPMGLIDADGSLTDSAPVLVITGLMTLLWLHVATVLVLVVLEAVAPTASIPSLPHMILSLIHI